MEYREFEKLGVKTSLLGFGCMRFPLHRDGSINREKAEQMIDAAYQSGVNYFDTAYPYHQGKSEEFTGQALDKYDRSSYYLATKLPCWLINSLEDAERIFNEQLTRLHKDYIDFYLLHSMNKGLFDKMVKLGILDFLDKLREQGKIRYIGFSFHDSYEAFSYILSSRKWDFCQIQFNYMDTDIQAGTKGYELTEKLGVPLVIMEPVKGGLLAKLPAGAANCLRRTNPGKSIASFALRFVATHPNVRVVLSGMSDPKQVADNLETFKNFEPLNAEEQQAIEKAAALLHKRVRVGCTGCSYCMPCPAGVNIPQNFHIWNEYGIYKNSGHSKWFWTNDIDDKSKAKSCISCGRCETLCPQKLPIRESLKRLEEELDTL